MSATMTLVLVRHGEAGPAASDELRSLTAEGRGYVRRAGALLMQQPEPIDAIVCSPLVRAVQTAEVLAGALGVDGPVSAHPAIAFPARVEQLLEVAADQAAHARGVMVVGHEPTMGVLAEHLLGAVSRQAPFRTGTMLVMEWVRGTAQVTPLYAITGHPPGLRSLQT